jgi:hypothetical protein
MDSTDSTEVTVSVPVYLAVGLGEGAELPNAVQCPVCYAIVLASRLPDHQVAAH